MKQIVLLLVVIVLTGCMLSTNITNKVSRNGLASTGSIGESGVNPSVFNRITQKLESQEYPNIHSLLIAKNGRLIYERYFQGEDRTFGENFGIVQFDEATLHDIRSISKSVVSALIGISIDKGLIQNVDQPISIFFPEYQFSGEKSQWTIQHFLTMTTGLAWNEKIPYTDPENSAFQMLRSDDPVRFILTRPLEHVPGNKWNYSGGATLILSKIIERASGMSVETFAETYLFAPLDIKQYEWNKFSKIPGGTDIIAAGSGLRLTPKSLLKFALLYRNNGVWQTKRVLSESWVKDSFKRSVSYPCDPGFDCVNYYGYQFYSWDEWVLGEKISLVVAMGSGDQRIYWDRTNDILVIVTAGNYHSTNFKKDSYALLLNEIYPAVFGSKKN